MMRRLAGLLTITIVASCGGTTSSSLIPMLPSEGDSTERAASSGGGADNEVDPWKNAELIPPPVPLEPKALALPATTTFKLRNGLEVLVVPSDNIPAVSFQLFVRAGRNQEDRRIAGIARVAAEMLAKGTKRRSAEKIAETIDFVGGRLSAGVGYESASIGCAALSKDIGTCLSLLPEVVASPTFPAAELTTVKQQLTAEVRGRLDDAGQMASAQFDNFLWGDDHPRGHVMSLASIGNIARKDIVSWHKNWFVPRNSYLAVAGKVDPKTIEKQLNKAFGKWRNRGKAKVPAMSGAAVPLAKVRVLLVDKPEQTQTHIRVGHFGIAHGDPDFYNMLVMNYVLGGGAFSSRLMKVVRSEGGKTYGASSAFDRDIEPGAFVMTTFTRTAETVATIKLLVSELEKMAKVGPTDTEVRDAITNIAGAYSTRFSTAEDFAGAIARAKLHGLGPEYVGKFALRVGEVTQSSVARVANKRLASDKLAIVVVGNAAKIGPQLDSAGLAYAKVGNAEPVANYEREAEKRAAEAPVDPKAERRGRAILKKTIKAHGGAKRLAGIKSYRYEADATMMMGGKSIPAKMVQVYVTPDRLRVEQAIGGFANITVALVSGKGWGILEQGTDRRVVDVPASEVAVGTAKLWRDPLLILMRAQEKGATVLAAPAEKIDGESYSVLEIRGSNGQKATLLINAKTHRLSMIRYKEMGQTLTEFLSDYKKVSGVLVPHVRKGQQPTPQGLSDLEMKATKVVINPVVDPKLFEKPAK